MNILISNDDGIDALGLRTLVKVLGENPENRVYVSAPDGQRSACGHGITMKSPIFVNDGLSVEGAVWAQSLSGTPADCVKYGIRRLKNEMGITIDLVISGINHGGNIGTDVFYSGTVSAAAEGVICGASAISLSIGEGGFTEENFRNCAEFACRLCEKTIKQLKPGTLLNVNFPPLPPAEIRGIRVTRLGPREYDESFPLLENPRGQKYYWYSGEFVVYNDLPEDLDVMAHQAGYVTVTPLQLDLTDYGLRDSVGKMLPEL